MRCFSWLIVGILLTGQLACNSTDKNEPFDNQFNSASEAVQEPRFSTISDDSGLNSARVKSTESLSYFLKAFESQKYKNVKYLVKAKFTDPKTSKQLHMWVALQALKGKSLICMAIEVPEDFDGLSMGQDISLTTNEVEDWMINDSGVVYGAYTLRLQREKLPEDQKASFDQYVGIKSFANKLP